MSDRRKAILIAVGAVIAFAFFPTLAEVVGKPWQGSLPSVALSGLGGIASGAMGYLAVHFWRRSRRSGTVTVRIVADTSAFERELRKAEERIRREGWGK